MRSFLFKSLSLLAPMERRARTLPFAPTVNAIIGRNHRGKSTVLRMLYYPLGCETRKLGPQWTRACFINRFGLKSGTFAAGLSLAHLKGEQASIRTVDRCAVDFD